MTSNDLIDENSDAALAEALKHMRTIRQHSRVKHACWCAIMDAICDFIQVAETDRADAAPKIADKRAAEMVERIKELC
ncbi:MAG: hypothetical protein K8U57_35930 [Planctomycetes bacterium]|nr:hypothetical protein [Planctomycetota bacterium]